MRENHEAQIIAFLANAEQEPGGDGWKTTREIAEHLGISSEAARDRLEKLYGDQKIDFGKDDTTLPIIYLWHAMPKRVKLESNPK